MFRSEPSDLRYLTRDEALKFLKTTDKLTNAQKKELSLNINVNSDYEFLVVYSNKLDIETFLKKSRIDSEFIEIVLNAIPEKKKSLVYKTQKVNYDSDLIGWLTPSDILDGLLETKSLKMYDINKLFYNLNKKKLVEKYKLSPKFIFSNFYYLNNTETYIHQDLTQLISDHPEMVNWKKVSKYQKLPDFLCIRHCYQIDWKVFNCDHLEETFKMRLKKFINWNLQNINLLSEESISTLFKENIISDSKLATYKNEPLIVALFNNIQIFDRINEIFSVPRTEFIAFEIANLDGAMDNKQFWNKVSSTVELSETFVNIYRSFLNVKTFPNYNLYSDDFIDKNKSNIDWKRFSLNTTIKDPEFFKKYSSYIVWSYLFDNSNLPENIRLQFRNKVKVDYLKTFDNQWFRTSKENRKKKLLKYYDIEEDTLLCYIDRTQQNKKLINKFRPINCGTLNHFDEKQSLIKIYCNYDDCYLNIDLTIRVIEYKTKKT